MLEGRRGTALGLALFLGLGTFGIWSEISSQHHPTSQAPHRASDSAKPYIDPRSSEERIADYTLWLERFTGLLALVSAVQIFFLIRADRTARISADAAKTAAEAIPLLERPYIFVYEIAFHRNPGRITNPPWITYTVSNNGKLAAVIDNVSIRCGKIINTEYPPLIIIGDHPLLQKRILSANEKISNISYGVSSEVMEYKDFLDGLETKQLFK